MLKTSDTIEAKVSMLYGALLALPRHKGACTEVCSSGLYFFFESGQLVRCESQPFERVVRVGTHLYDGGMPDRIGNHFSSNRHGSIFRKHLGNAIINSGSSSAALIHKWLTKGERPMPSVEGKVSEALLNDFTYVCVPVSEADDRKRLEKGLIGLLASFYREIQLGPWRGSLARTKKGAPRLQAGLWNVQHIKAAPLSNQDLQWLLEKLNKQAKAQACQKCSPKRTYR